jgi:hypothetical protein
MKNGLGGLKKKWQKQTLSDIKRLKLPEPDHEYGFSTGLLERHLSPTELERFFDWMTGQTCAVDDKLGVINYTWDVLRGLDYIRHGTKTYWD